ncbi:ABC transporter permease [Candidatus Peregrinibacteria bacterium]|nr:ABC transporter permease [Candidatus Peregrinibacteria bacterium]
MLALIKKELRSYFNSPIAYIFITVFLVLTGWLFFRSFFIANQASMRDWFSLLPWIFLFLIPAVTMRLWAEEKKLGTFEVLMTLPVKDFEVVLGKFLASFIFLAIALVLTLPIPLIISFLGSPDKGVIFAQYLSALLLGGAYLAIGLFVSSATSNQIIAFILAVSISFFFLIIGEPIVLYVIPSLIAPLFQYLGLGAHFESMGRGVIDSRDFLYYLSMIFLFLFLNMKNIESRKWK